MPTTIHYWYVYWIKRTSSDVNLSVADLLGLGRDEEPTVWDGRPPNQILVRNQERVAPVRSFIFYYFFIKRKNIL